MLGAQAIRTKQKTKERKKKLSGLELQCERIQKVAREDEAKFLEKVAHLHLEDARAVSEIAEETKRIKQKRHHSVQEPPSVRLSSIANFDNSSPFSKSSSVSSTKVVKPERSGMDFVNTEETVDGKGTSKWCGLLASFSSAGNSRRPSKNPPKRRMSTFI